MDSKKLKKINEFLRVENEAVQSWQDGHKDYFTYSKVSPIEFLRYANNFEIPEIEEAIVCVIENRWDESEFIMRIEHSGTLGLSLDRYSI